jgi:type IV pilus assembly protein PilC
MKKYRYIGTRATGHTIRGTIAARDKNAAKTAVARLESKESFTLRSIIQERIFAYQVQKGSERPVRGEQRAFEKSDVETALWKMGFRVLSVHRKFYFFKLAPPTRDIVVFIRICADMLKEKLPYDEILQLLITDTTNKSLKITLREISKDLKEGKDGK